MQCANKQHAIHAARHRHNPLSPGPSSNAALPFSPPACAGLASYGRATKFAGGNAQPGIGSTTNPWAGPQLRGDCTQQPYTLAWYEIKRMGLQANVDRRQLAAWAVTSDNQYWVGFDTPETHRLKMCWARSKGISSVMMWDTDLDDQNEMLRGIKASAADPCEGYQAPKC